ncbi:MAG: hypothetical protein GF393_07565, partial [Armatimonadia bacterium]|nr:hypothetical protein [Armatimonadia bacterium]
MRRFQIAAAVVSITILLIATPVLALDLGLPDLEDVGGDILKGRIPGLNKILQEEPGISTSFDDAVFGVAVIDGFNPPVTAPMTQLPTTGDGGYIIALPGVYEYEAKSFCLHAGTYGPGQGEGYLWAPLKGSQAGVVRDILDNYMMYPELAQEEVQSLIWAIQSRAKINKMPDELQDVAQVLLTKKQIRRLNGGALAIIPDELMDQAFVDVPDEVRMVLEAEARLRDRLRQEVYDFDALEEVAVLAGDPAPDEGGPVIPRGRWSFDPSGVFVRYEPHGYSSTTVQLYAPEPFRALTDELGRITSLTDRAGRTLQLQYASTDPTSMQGDVATWALAGIHLLDPGGDAYEVACTAADTINTGGVDGSDAMRSIRELARNVDGASPDSPLVDNVVNFAHVVDAVRAVAEREGVGNRVIREMEAMGHRAVASELALLLQGRESETAFRPLERETRLAALPWATGAVIDMSQAAWGDFTRRPVWRSSRGTGTPASRGRQRLGISGGPQLKPFKPDSPYDRDDDDDNEPSGSDDKGSTSNARDAIDKIQKGKDAIDIATDVKGWPAGKIGMGIPDYLFGKILDFNFDAWGKASKALGGDPPVEDYDEIALPQPISLPAFAPGADEVSPAHTVAVNALSDALADNFAIVRAANVTEDRLGGALAADDREWIDRHAAQLVEYKRQAGVGMMQIGTQMYAVLQALRAAGVQDITITPEAVQAYQQRLQAQGFDAQEQQAAQLL